VRALLAAVVALHVLSAAVSPHAHLGGFHAEERCAACVVRAADAVQPAVPDLAPVEIPAGDVAADPGVHPVTGAPLGAVPGQSPPAVA
jgi:hypothetical protein